MNEGIEKGGRGLTHASAGLVAQADEAEAHLLTGSPPLFVFPGSLMLGTGSWDSCALSRQIFSDELCFVGSQVRTSKSVVELVRESITDNQVGSHVAAREKTTDFLRDGCSSHAA